MSMPYTATFGGKNERASAVGGRSVEDIDHLWSETDWPTLQ